MKTTLCLCAVALLASCAPSLNKDRQVNDDCLDLTGSKEGFVTFKVNPKYETFPRTYLIKVYEKGPTPKLIDARVLLRNTAIEQKIEIDKTNLSKYCITISKDQNLAGYKQMEWDNNNAKQASIHKNQKIFYASTINSPLLLVKTITSKDGAAGEGVRAVID